MEESVIKSTCKLSFIYYRKMFFYEITDNKFDKKGFSGTFYMVFSYVSALLPYKLPIGFSDARIRLDVRGKDYGTFTVISNGNSNTNALLRRY